MKVRDPLPLVHGKGADAIFSAAVDFLQSLRQMGHQGIAVQHYAFDRALHSALVRRYRQHHAQLALAQGGSATGSKGKALWDPPLLEWVVDTACANHDTHNGLKWAMMSWMGDASLMKTVFIVVESIRNGFSLLEDEVGRWVVRVVKWVPGDELMDQVEVVAGWSALGLEPRWADHLADLGIVFRGGSLLVNEKHRHRPEVWTEIMCCVRHGLKFTKFSDSRWCTLGRTCRQMLHSQLLGLNSLVKAVLDDPTASDYLIGGYRQLTKEVQHFMCVGAFASSPQRLCCQSC